MIDNIFDSIKNNESQHLCNQALAAVASSLLCLSAGLTNGISAVLLPKLLQDSNFSWDNGFGSWIAAIAPISSVLGCVFVGSLLDALGRRSMHLILAFPFVVGWLVMAYAPDHYTMIVGRFITGLSYGAARPTTIIYLGEISDPSYRGIMLLCTSLALNLGVLLSHVVGTVFAWRTSLLICIVPSVMLFVMIFFVKESPYWLIAKGRAEEGIDSFRWFRGRTDEAERELQNILEKHKGKSSRCNFVELCSILCSRAFIKPTVTVIFIFCAVQMCGINAFPFYAYDLLKVMFYGTNFNTFLLIMVVDFIRVVVSIAVCFFGKRMPRKITFLVTTYGTSLVLFALVFCRIHEELIIMPLALLVIYTALASAIASLGWTFIAELYPTKVRGLGSGLSGAICFSLLALCVKITPGLLSYGEPIIYGTFGIATLLCAIVLSFILSETNGMMLQDIEDSYNRKDKDISVSPL